MVQLFEVRDSVFNNPTVVDASLGGRYVNLYAGRFYEGPLSKPQPVLLRVRALCAWAPLSAPTATIHRPHVRISREVATCRLCSLLASPRANTKPCDPTYGHLAVLDSCWVL